MGDAAEEVWTAVLRSLRTRGLEFEDVHLGDVEDVEAVLRDVFPEAPLYRALAATTWLRLSRILCPPEPSAQRAASASVAPSASPGLTGPLSAAAASVHPLLAHQQQEMQQHRLAGAHPLAGSANAVDAFGLFTTALAARNLQFSDIVHASVPDRWALLTEVFPHHPLWRAQVNSIWAQHAAADRAAPVRSSSQAPTGGQFADDLRSFASRPQMSYVPSDYSVGFAPPYSAAYSAAPSLARPAVVHSVSPAHGAVPYFGVGL
eukprot:TRINITY_DN15244_c0_g1_i1.p1 TRINITY_DN15244_c0_g1~~TRINITY_DN15244_c0_g1_i1.p1  ORF type:complete len:262 (+),score=53.59 TRINITY_DN15244_c0_g1_i1:49-834(+)